MSKSNGNLSYHESGLVLWEPSNLNQMSEELSALNEVHEEEYPQVVLKHIVHAHDEWMLDRVQNLLLKFQRVHLLIFKDHVFSNALHSINLLSFPVHHLEHFSKSTFAYNTHHLKVLQLCIILFGILMDLSKP